MPPRYVYWTILIDDAPTAFRASERDDLLPTLHQLQRKNKNVVLKWFARGKLWDSPDAERQTQATARPPERRNQDWRPGGQHKDPRARFDKEAQRRKKREQRASGPPQRDFNPRAPKQPWTPKARPQPRWQSPPPAERAGRDAKRPWSSKPPSTRGGVAGRKPWEKDRTGESERKPWQNKAREGDRKPWQNKPREGDRKPWRDRPSDPARKSAPRRENEPPKREETPDRPPAPEQIVTKPKPPERG